MKKLSYLFPYFRRYKGPLTAGLAAILAASVVGLASPIVIGRAVDSLRSDLSRQTLLFYAGLLVGGHRGAGPLHLPAAHDPGDHEPLDRARHGDRFFAHLETQPLSFFQSRQTGDLMARATNDLGAVRMICGPAIMYAGNTVFTGLGSLVLHDQDPPAADARSRSPPCRWWRWPPAGFGDRIHHHFDDRPGTLLRRSRRGCRRTWPACGWCAPTPASAVEEASFDRANLDYVEANRALIRWNAGFHRRSKG